jgi:hypothetical protein
VNGVDISSTYATQTALGLKQDQLTAITTNVPVLNDKTIRALTGSQGVSVSAVDNIITIQGPNLTTYAPLSNPSFTGRVTTPALTVTDILETSATEIDAVQHLICTSGLRSPMLTTASNTIMDKSLLGKLLRCTGSSQSISLISPTVFPGGYFEVLVTNSTSFTIFEGTFTGPFGSGTNTVTLAPTPTPLLPHDIQWRLLAGAGRGWRTCGYERFSNTSNDSDNHRSENLLGHNELCHGERHRASGERQQHQLDVCHANGSGYQAEHAFERCHGHAAAIRHHGQITVSGVQCCPLVDQRRGQYIVNSPPPTELTLLHQNWTIAGGGTVTIRNIGDTAVYIRWSTRILVTPLCNKASSNYYQIECPTTGSIGTGELTPMMGSSSGNPTNSYAALYYVLPTTQTTDTNLSPPRFNYGSVPGNFRLITYLNSSENITTRICAGGADLLGRWSASRELGGGNVAIPVPNDGQSSTKN